MLKADSFLLDCEDKEQNTEQPNSRYATVAKYPSLKYLGSSIKINVRKDPDQRHLQQGLNKKWFIPVPSI